jgi:exopolyphosphatase/guanosine-5'-triphosphate,3'-diphosphate pyrophosphatase
VIAQIARYHRKSAPKASHAEFAALSDGDQQLVRTLAAILRIAIGLDRSHRGHVRAVRADVSPSRVLITVDARPGDGRDLSLELYAANERKDLLETVLGRPVELVAATP